jgi:hypothetical protein
MHVRPQLQLKGQESRSQFEDMDFFNRNTCAIGEILVVPVLN